MLFLIYFYRVTFSCVWRCQLEFNVLVLILLISNHRVLNKLTRKVLIIASPISYLSFRIVRSPTIQGTSKRSVGLSANTLSFFIVASRLFIISFQRRLLENSRLFSFFFHDSCSRNKVKTNAYNWHMKFKEAPGECSVKWAEV